GSTTRRAGRPLAAFGRVAEDAHLLHRDETAPHEAVHFRQHRLEVLPGVDALDHERQILGQPQDVRRVDHGIRAESGDAPHDGRAGEASGPEQLDERGEERPPAGTVGLPDEHAHQDLLAVDLSHGYTRTPTTSRPTAVPRTHTVRQSAVVARTLIHAWPHAPASMRR